MHPFFRVDLASESKVTYPHPFLLINQDVFWLDVPVDQSLRVQPNYPKGDLRPNGIFLSHAHPLLLTFLRLSPHDTVEVAIGTVVDDEVDILGVLELVVQLYLVLRAVFQDLEFVFYHIEVPLLAQFGLVDPLQAEQMPVVSPLNQEDLGVGALAYLIDHLEVLHRYDLDLAVNLVFLVRRRQHQ